MKRRLFHRCVFVFKYANGLIDFNFDTKRNYDIHSYNTRGKTNFYLTRIRRNYGKQRLLYQGLVDWNKLKKLKKQKQKQKNLHESMESDAVRASAAGGLNSPV